MNIDELLRTAVENQVGAVEVPRPDVAALMQRGRRSRRVRAAVTTIVAAGVVVVAVLISTLVVHRSDQPTPTHSVPLSGPVWIDRAGLHMGKSVLPLKVAHVKRFLLTSEGPVYTDGKTTWLQPPDGDARRLPAPWVASADRTSSVLAWQENRGGRAVVATYDIASGHSRLTAPFGPKPASAQGTGPQPFLASSIDGANAYVATSGCIGCPDALEIWTFDVRSTAAPTRWVGTSTPHGGVELALGTVRADYSVRIRFMSTSGAQLSSVRMRGASGALSPDGRYFLVHPTPLAPSGAEVVETANGTVHRFAVGPGTVFQAAWGYGDRIMVTVAKKTATGYTFALWTCAPDSRRCVNLGSSTGRAWMLPSDNND